MKEIDSCDFCNLTETEKHWLLFENECWSAYLSDMQDYPGRCIVVLRDHKESLSELGPEEWICFGEAAKVLEGLVKEELGAILCNWSCLMNNAFKSRVPHPHVHFHMRPRFNEKTTVFGAAFEDTIFAHHYAVGGNTTLPVQSAQKLYEHLKEKLPFYMELCKKS